MTELVSREMYTAMVAERDALAADIARLARRVTEFDFLGRRVNELLNHLSDMQRHRDQWRRYAYSGENRPSDYLNEAPASSPEQTAVDRLTAQLAAAHGLQARADLLVEVLEIIAGERQCIDNLMSHAEIARAALLRTRGFVSGSPARQTAAATPEPQTVAQGGEQAAVAAAHGLQARAERAEAALSAASGYLTNAMVDLETGAPKRTAIATIKGGLAMVRAALAAVPS